MQSLCGNSSAILLPTVKVKAKSSRPLKANTFDRLTRFVMNVAVNRAADEEKFPRTALTVMR